MSDTRPCRCKARNASDLLPEPDENGRAVCKHCEGSLFIVSKSYRGVYLIAVNDEVSWDEGEIDTEVVAGEVDDEMDCEIRCDCDNAQWCDEMIERWQ